MKKELLWVESDKIGGSFEIVTPETLDYIFRKAKNFLLFQGLHKDEEGNLYLAFGDEDTLELFAVKIV